MSTTLIPVKANTVARSAPVLLARVVGADGSPVTQATVAAVEYRVRDLTAGTSGSRTGVAVAACVFNTLQTGGPWDFDATGYNFRFVVPASEFDFDPTADDLPGPHRYQVDVRFTPVSGEPFVVPFELWAWPVWIDS